MEIVKNTTTLYLDQPSRVILELTNICNLDCDMCLRRSFNDISGSMPKVVFSKLISDFSEYSSPPEIFFGGYGEPLIHPDILVMVKQATDIGSQTTLITNGTLLTTHLVESLVEAGLNKIWISLDSSHQDALLQSRVGEIQTSIMDNLAEILRSGNGKLEMLEPGLAMVLTGKNEVELLDQLDNGRKLGLRSFFITYLEAYSEYLTDEVPYSLKDLRQPVTYHSVNSDLIEVLEKLSADIPEVSIHGTLTKPGSKCPFAERGDLVLRWDGEISPCLPLLYDRVTYIGSWEHKQFSHSLGNIHDRSISEIWGDSDYSLLRESLLNNDFSPCLSCRDCWLSDDNLQDCMGFEHPTCGGCLWAAGLICCP
jgi:MoaA/NifB/PqqE/SkfB family radical SAM enzyme